MDWAFWSNRDSAEFAAAIRHCASLTHGIRARSYRVNSEVTILAKQTCGYCLISIVSQKSVSSERSSFLSAGIHESEWSWISSNPVCGKLSLSGEVSVFSSARYGQLHQLCNFRFRGVSGGRGNVFREREEIVLGGSGCCLSSFWLSRRHLLRAPDRFISAPSEVISNRGRGFVNHRF